MPLVRMGLIAAQQSSTKTDKQSYIRLVRSKFKGFCFLPKCMPNKTVNYLLGNVEAIADSLVRRTTHNLLLDGLAVQT